MEFMSRVEEELRCPHCRRLFVDAVLLPCSHSVCLQCAVYLASHPRTSPSTSTSFIARSKTDVDGLMAVGGLPDDIIGVSDRRRSAFVSSSSVTTAVDPPALPDPDRASVGSETDSGVVCTTTASVLGGGGATVNGRGGTTDSRPSSYLSGDVRGVSAPSVGNLSTSSQDSGSSSGGGPVVGIGTAEIRCPRCRRSTFVDDPTVVGVAASLPRNRTLEGVVDRYRETRQLPIDCQFCGEVDEDEEDGVVDCTVLRRRSAATAAVVRRPATVLCEVCQAFYCDDCLLRRHSAPRRDVVVQPHAAVTSPAAKGKAWLAAVGRGRASTCLEHADESLSLYCIPCRTAVCCLCAEAGNGEPPVHPAGRHATHQTRPAGTMSRSHKSDLSQLLHALSEKVKTSTESLQKLKAVQDQIEVNGVDFEAAVVRQCDALIDAICRRRAELLTEVRELKARKQQSVVDQLAECTSKLHRTTGLLQFGIESLKEQDPTAFLLTSDSLISRVTYITESLDRELQLEPRLSPQFEYIVDTEPAVSAIETMDLLEMKVPKPPTILVDRCLVDNNVITVTWQDHVTSGRDVSYVLELDDGNCGQFREVYRGSRTACTVEGLHFDTEYRTRVGAFNRVGCSEYSAVVRIHTAEVAYFALDPMTAHQDVLFSNDNQTVTSSSFDDRVVLGSVGLSRGVHYWEFCVDRYENNKDPAFGVALRDVARDRMIGQDDRGWSMYIDNARSWFTHAARHTDRTAGGISAGSVVGVLLDLPRRTLSFYVNGERHGGAAHASLPSNAVFYPAVSLNRNVQVTLQTGLAPPSSDTDSSTEEK